MFYTYAFRNARVKGTGRMDSVWLLYNICKENLTVIISSYMFLKDLHLITRFSDSPGIFGVLNIVMHSICCECSCISVSCWNRT